MLLYFNRVKFMKNKILCLLPLFALLATSCNGSSSTSISSSSNNSSSSSSEGPIENKGVVQIKDLSLLNRDLKNAYAPALGDVKMLVVPIAFAGNTAQGYESKLNTWSSSKISKINSYYFAENDSLASYYYTGSFGKLRITGEVTAVYQNTDYSIKNILEDDSMEVLRDLMDAAVNWLYDTDDSINWQQYDLNHDGCIDNIHFISNYNSTTWAENLWPHMFWTNRQGTIEKPMVNVYSMSCLSHMDGPITSIHEQGHIFGLDDYYDYSNNGQSSIDYIGGLDMQSMNMFDWNSYSKLSTGWVDPYVVDGSEDTAVVTLKAASLNGDCLIIPADCSSWNGSAFDEYFLIELFAPFGNNVDDWNNYGYLLDNEPGVRMYHVDARAFGSNKIDPDNNELLIVDDLDAQAINSKEDCGKWKYITRGANNCSNWRDYEGGIEQLGDHQLLTIIQKGGEFTFGDPSSARHTLNGEDLFRTGDKFTFDKYSHFLNKSGKKQAAMNNGEAFPYEISFGEMTSDSIVVTIKKVK